jgi:hypothetical protein
MSTTLLITVVGQQRRVDLEVPGDIPIRDLLPKLLEICGSSPYNTPSLWRLGRYEAPSFFETSASLNAVGAVDGDLLALQPFKDWEKQKSNVFSPPLIPGVVIGWDKEGLVL